MSNIHFGIITSEREDEVWSNGGHIGSVGQGSYNLTRDGGIYRDGVTLHAPTSNLFVETGDLIEMEIDMDTDDLAFRNVTKDKEYKVKLTASYNAKPLHFYVTLSHKGDSI